MIRRLYNQQKFILMKKTISWLSILLHWMEIIVAIVAIVVALIGVISIISSLQLTNLIQSHEEFYINFETLFSNILLIIIGLELAILLIRRSPESLVEVMFFIVARKMLIKAEGIWDLLIGVAAIAGLFAVRKYLEHPLPKRQLLITHSKEKKMNKSKIKQ